MHMTIGALVFASSRDDAIDKATTIFEWLVERQKFDYYNIEQDGAHKAISKKGKETIEILEKHTQQELCRNLDIIRDGLETFTNEDIWNEKDNKKLSGSTTIIRHCMYCAGMYHGHSLFLYDQDGCGIQSKSHLNSILDKWNGKYTDDLWVVTANVHY